MWSVETIILLSTEKGRIILNFSCGAFFTKTTFSTNLPPFQWEVSSSLIHPFVRLLENPACWSGLKSGPRFAAVNEINNLHFEPYKISIQCSHCSMQSPHSLKGTVSQQFSRLFLVCKLLTMKDNFGKEFSPNDTDTNFPDHDQSNESSFRRTFTWCSLFDIYL